MFGFYKFKLKTAFFRSIFCVCNRVNPFCLGRLGGKIPLNLFVLAQSRIVAMYFGRESKNAQFLMVF